MYVRDHVDLDRRSLAEFADGVRAARGVRHRRLAFLPKRQPVEKRDARLQGAAGDCPVRHTAVDHDLGLFRHRICAVGLVGSRERAVAEGLEPYAEQKTGESRVVKHINGFFFLLPVAYLMSKKYRQTSLKITKRI